MSANIIESLGCNLNFTCDTPEQEKYANAGSKIQLAIHNSASSSEM
jgi:hypothetical protein